MDQVEPFLCAEFVWESRPSLGIRFGFFWDLLRLVCEGFDGFVVGVLLVLEQSRSKFFTVVGDHVGEDAVKLLPAA